MKNIKTLEHFLLESKNSAMRYLRSGCMDEDTFYDFLDMDKTPTKKFVEKMCQFYCEGEDGGYVFDIFSQLMRLKIFDFDINSIETLSDLVDIIEDYKLSGKRERIKLDPSLDGGVLVFQNERFDVLYIGDKESSCHYGQGTRWCISANISINTWGGKEYEHLNFYFVFDYQTMDKSLKRLAVGVPNQKGLESIVWNSRDNQTGTRVNMNYLYEQGIPENVFKYHKRLK